MNYRIINKEKFIKVTFLKERIIYEKTHALKLTSKINLIISLKTVNY